MGDENSQNELVEETGMQSDSENRHEDQADNETDSQDEFEGTSNNILMQHEAYTAYMHYATIHCTYIICTQAMKLTPMRNVKVHKKVVIVYHCKPFDLNVCAYNYPYTTIIIPTEGLHGDIKKG